LNSNSKHSLIFQTENYPIFKFKMFRFVILSVFIAVASAGVIDYAPAVAIGHELKHEIGHEIKQVTKTVVEPHYTEIQTPTINHVGSVVKSIPTGVSHHSSSVVHSHAQVHEPIYAHGVEKQVISKPVIKTIAEPIIEKRIVSTPVVAAPVYKQVYAAPAVHYSAPVVKQVVAAPVVKQVVAAPVQYSYAAPAQYAYAAPAAYGYASYAPQAYAYKAW
jgi:hypothetical protein